MKGKSFFAAAAGLTAGFAAGWALAQHVGIGFCTNGEENARRGYGPEKPPLRVKPVPIVRKTRPQPEEHGADGTPQEDAE